MVNRLFMDSLSIERMLLGCLLNIVDRALLRGHQTAYEHESVQSWWPIAARALIDCWYRRLKTVGRHSFDCW